MKPIARRLITAIGLALPVAVHAAEPHRLNTSIPEHHAADPQASPVTEENLLENERFWPYKVKLREALTPKPGAKPISNIFPGVLIRVEPGDIARIDFGRDGLHDVPVAKTDLVERANRIRTGEDPKSAPNFVAAIGARLVDPSTDPARPLPFAEVAESRVFLCVFADPDAEATAAMAEELSTLREREGLLTIFFPAGRATAAAIASQLRDWEWPVPYILPHVSAGYTATLIDASDRPPFTILQTGEGKVLFAGRWERGAIQRVRSVVDEALAEGVEAPPPTPSAR